MSLLSFHKILIYASIRLVPNSKLCLMLAMLATVKLFTNAHREAEVVCQILEPIKTHNYIIFFFRTTTL